METLFDVQGINVHYGGLKALSNVSFSVQPGDTVGIIGANGAGKTTLLNCITGMVAPNEGSIRFEGVDILGRRPYALLRLGLARSFQSPTYFRDMTVLEYVVAGRLDRVGGSLIQLALRPRRARRQYREHESNARAKLSEFGISQDADTKLGELPYGMQKYVDIVRALAADPRLLFLDEPTSGSSGEERDLMEEMIVRIQQEGTTLVMVDHDIAFVRRRASSVVLMDAGEIVAMGDWDQVASSEATQAILGVGL